MRLNFVYLILVYKNKGILFYLEEKRNLLNIIFGVLKTHLL